MLRYLRHKNLLQSRPYKNFGHKRVPEATVTVLWQGFLTFTFIGMGIEWKRIYKFFFEKESQDEELLSIQPAEPNKT